MTPKEIGEMIRLRRESRGWTQAELASRIGMSESAIGMYESGRRKPKDETVEALADVFNVPKWSIVYREDEVGPIFSGTTDEELKQIRDDMERKPELRDLYDIQRRFSRTQLKQMKTFIDAMRSSNDYDETDTP